MGIEKAEVRGVAIHDFWTIFATPAIEFELGIGGVLIGGVFSRWDLYLCGFALLVL